MRSARSSVIRVRAQLDEYGRADCLLFVWIGLKARLLLWFLAKTIDGGEMELSTLICAHCCCERNKGEGLAGQGAPTAIWCTRPTILGIFGRGVQAVENQGRFDACRTE